MEKKTIPYSQEGRTITTGQ